MWYYEPVEIKVFLSGNRWTGVMNVFFQPRYSSNSKIVSNVSLNQIQMPNVTTGANSYFIF
jgi:hypothetical protein